MEREIADGMEVLTQDECEQLLRPGGIGMLALCGVGAPILRPVNYAMVEGGIVLRTGEGQILEAATGSEPASFLISEIDRFEHTGWSVFVSGKLASRSPTDGVEEVPLRPWVRADKQHFVSLTIETISGRRIPEEVPSP